MGAPLLHDRIRAIDLEWLAAVPCSHCARAHAADVRCQEHDVCRRSTPRPLPHGGSALPWAYVDQGGGRADVECAEQKFFLLRRMDPEQHQGLRLRYST